MVTGAEQEDIFMNLYCDCNNGDLEITFIPGDISETTFLLVLYLGDKIHVSRKK